MYLEHFGLRESPFRITPHTEFFFSGANRGATLEALIYAITHDEGIVKVSGEVGSGKTMLCRMLLERLQKQAETVYLANPSLSRDEILFAIADELQIALPEGRRHVLLRALQDRLIEIHEAGRQVVVLIDEAHAMPPETLEEIRLLSNLETNRHKLLHIVLFGQPELDERLADNSMRQLKERITHNFALEPLRSPDVASYLMFRIRAAGYRGPDLFTPSAVQLMSHASEGLTRRINILADKALLSAFAENRHQIDHKQITAAIRDAQFSSRRSISSRAGTWIAAIFATVSIVSLTFFVSNYPLGKKTAEEQSLLAQQFPTQTQRPSSASASNPSAAHPRETRQNQNLSVPPRDAEEKTFAAPINAQNTASLGEQITATEIWLATVPDSHYFIQLISTDGGSPHIAEAFHQKMSRELDPLQLRIYRSRLSGRERYGVIYGDFATQEEARSELSRLNKNHPASGFYIRAVSKLR